MNSCAPRDGIVIHRRRSIIALAAILPLFASAHVGDQNAFFEGYAGPYPVRIVIRPPGVIPGLAEISVRVETNGIENVTALPMRWDSARQGAPPPDEAKRVRGETNLFDAQLWFMRGGAQSVEVAVSGFAGVGKVIVPVNAVAMRVLGMPRQLGWLLTSLGGLLVLLAVSIMGAAVRESVLPVGDAPTRGRRWFARAAVVLSAIGLGTSLWFGKNWWDAEATDYRNNRLYRPVDTTATVRLENNERILRIKRAADPSRRGSGPLVPEHGKLMHLFLVREPAMDIFAHLHPTKKDWNIFETPLPELPGGDYRVYADITYETGFSDTLTSAVHLPDINSATNAARPPADPDDGWRASEPFTGGRASDRERVALSSSLWMEMKLEGPLVENRDTRLQFSVQDAVLRPVPLDHFMGMAGHLILRHADGSVFTHLHPGGSFSMAAQQLFELRAEGKAPLKVASAKADPLCKLPLSALTNDVKHTTISFPYAFPKAGDYRLWVQVKVNDQVQTGVFDVSVASKAVHYAAVNAPR